MEGEDALCHVDAWAHTANRAGLVGRPNMATSIVGRVPGSTRVWRRIVPDAIRIQVTSLPASLIRILAVLLLIQ